MTSYIRGRASVPGCSLLPLALIWCACVLTAFLELSFRIVVGRHCGVLFGFSCFCGVEVLGYSSVIISLPNPGDSSNYLRARAPRLGVNISSFGRAGRRLGGGRRWPVAVIGENCCILSWPAGSWRRGEQCDSGPAGRPRLR